MFLELQVSWGSTYCSWTCLEVVSLYVSLSHPSWIIGKTEECSLGDGRGTRRQVETEKAYENLDLGWHTITLASFYEPKQITQLSSKSSRAGRLGGGQRVVEMCTAFKERKAKSHAKGINIKMTKNLEESNVTT